jgi:hypothetical protein
MQSIRRGFEKVGSLFKDPGFGMNTGPECSLSVVRHPSEDRVHGWSNVDLPYVITTTHGPLPKRGTEGWHWGERLGSVPTIEQLRFGEEIGRLVRWGVKELQVGESPSELRKMQGVYAEGVRFLSNANVFSQTEAVPEHTVLNLVPPGERLLERTHAVSLALMAIGFSRYFADATLIAGLPLDAALRGVASDGDFVHLSARLGWLCAAVARAEVKYMPRGEPCEATVVLNVHKTVTRIPSKIFSRNGPSRKKIEHFQYAELYVRITRADTNAVIREYPLAYEPPRTWLEGKRPPQPQTNIVKPAQVCDRNYYRASGGVFTPGAPIEVDIESEIKTLEVK